MRSVFGRIAPTFRPSPVDRGLPLARRIIPPPSGRVDPTLSDGAAKRETSRGRQDFEGGVRRRLRQTHFRRRPFIRLFPLVVEMLRRASIGPRQNPFLLI